MGLPTGGLASSSRTPPTPGAVLFDRPASGKVAQAIGDCPDRRRSSCFRQSGDAEKPAQKVLAQVEAARRSRLSRQPEAGGRSEATT